MKENSAEHIIRSKIAELEEADTSIDTGKLWRKLDASLGGNAKRKIRPFHYWMAAAAILLMALLIPALLPYKQTIVATRTMLHPAPHPDATPVTKNKGAIRQERSTPLQVSQRSNLSKPHLQHKHVTAHIEQTEDENDDTMDDYEDPAFMGLYANPLTSMACYNISIEKNNLQGY